MNKLSSHPEKYGVSPSVSKTPSNVFSRLRRMGAGVAMLAAAACSYNPASRTFGGRVDGGNREDVATDVAIDTTPRQDSGPDARGEDGGEVDAGADVGVDAGADATDAGVDVGPDVGEDVAGDVGADVGVDDAGEDATAADAGADGGGEADAAAAVPPCTDTDLDLVCDDNDLCDLDPAEDDADGDGCDDLNGDDVCLGNDENNDDSDGDGKGDGIVIGPRGEVIACDPYPGCNPPADGAIPDAEGRFPPEEIWCDRDDDRDGIQNQEDCYPQDLSLDCSDRADGGVVGPDGGSAEGGADASPDANVGEWLKKRIRELLKGKGENVPSETQLA